MCFYVKSNYGVTPKVAKVPIYCFKGLRVDKLRVESPIVDFTWTPNEEYVEKKFKLKPNMFKEVNFGFHAFNSIEKAKRFIASNKNQRVFLMEIPKGAKYYMNEDQYCSNKMILRQKIKA